MSHRRTQTQKAHANVWTAKNYTLEELDVVFNIGNHDHAKYYRQKIPWYVKRWTGRKPPPYPTLMESFDPDTVAAGSENEKSGQV